MKVTLEATWRSFAAAALLVAGLPSIVHVRAQEHSPDGSWSCAISGTRNGLASFAFLSDTNGGTFSGVEVLVPKSLPPARASLINGVAGSLGSNALGRATQSTGRTNMVFYGGFSVSGPWSFDRQQRITGSFLEIAPDRVTCRTNVVPLSTNLFEATNAIFETNLLFDTFCITLPLLTNLVPISYEESQTCYMNLGPINSSTFTNPGPIIQTTVSSGTACKTVPIATLTNGLFVNQTTCYAIAALSTNSFQTPNRIENLEEITNASFCQTFPIFTNLVPSTFTNRTICYTNQLNCSGVTNTVNFVGKATAGKRLILNAQSPTGNFTVRGVPASALVDLSGPWSGTKKQPPTNSFELFDLSAFTNTPNSYLVSGETAGYSYEGFALLSVQKKIGFGLTLFSGTNYKSTRATLGSFNFKSLKSKTTGIEAPGGVGALTNRLTFQVEKRNSVP